jgi:hypothetical protein
MQNAPSPPLFKGGSICNGNQCGGRFRGGNDNPPSFTGIPLRYYYAQNMHENDPSDPSMQIASRQLPNKIGGKKSIKKRGGSGLTFAGLSGQYGTTLSYNPLNTIGDMGTSQIASKILSGAIPSLPNTSVNNQPANTKYNEYNRPLA